MTWEGHVLSLVEQAALATDRSAYLVSLDGVSKGSVHFPPSYTPGIAIGTKEVVIWAGIRLYVLPVGRGEPMLEEYDDEVETVYVRPSTWILIGETSVAVLDPVLRCATSRWANNEVLIDSWWSNDELTVKDLKGRTFAVTFEADDRTIVVREEPDES